jgi:hypothetical protein
MAPMRRQAGVRCAVCVMGFEIVLVLKCIGGRLLKVRRSEAGKGLIAAEVAGRSRLDV